MHGRDYLTGFHKRKQERRRFGLDMEAYKVKKRQLEAKKQRREERKAQMAALNVLDDEKNTDEEDGEDDETSDSGALQDKKKLVLHRDNKVVTKVTTFNDDFTQEKFGDVVTVTTSVGDLLSDSDESDVEELKHETNDDDADDWTHSAFCQMKKKKKKVDNEQQLTLFQRIQQQRKGKALPSKRSKLKEARTARKAMLGKKGNTGNAVVGKKRVAEDGDGASSAANKFNKKLKMKSSHGGGNKRQKKR